MICIMERLEMYLANWLSLCDYNYVEVWVNWYSTLVTLQIDFLHS